MCIRDRLKDSGKRNDVEAGMAKYLAAEYCADCVEQSFRIHGGYASSRHSMSVSPIAGRGDNMQRDAWYTSMRHSDEMADPAALGRYAAERALSRLYARKIPTTCPLYTSRCV